MAKMSLFSFLQCCFALYLALLSGNANAFSCRTSDGGEISAGGSGSPVDVRVRIGPQLSYGRNEIVNVSQITCKNEVEVWRDFLKTDSSALTLNNSIFGVIGSGATINGRDYYSPVPAGIEVFSITNYQSTNVDIRVFILLNQFPTSAVEIKKGDVIGELHFIQSNDQLGCPNCGPYRWRLIADNDANFVTTSCSINNGQQIDVALGQIRQDYLTQYFVDAQIKQDKILTYNCQDQSATQDIVIRMVSDTVSFSSDFIKTSNPNVGIAMVYKNEIVKPNSSFTTRIVNGVGSDTITFIPVKNDVPYQSISTGALLGSATLIFSAP